jgi:predicted ATP-grasp superfamily ATP-dependent carboligase
VSDTGSLFHADSALVSPPAAGAIPAAPTASLRPEAPVLLLGGKENALSIARNLGRLGVTVRASGPRSCWALYSRYCTEGFPTGPANGLTDFWDRLLLSDTSHRLHGHILFPLSDEAIEYVAKRQERLAAHYRLDPATAAMRHDFLDKERTLELAHAAGFDVPRFWWIASEDDLAATRAARFPVIVKPVHSHKFVKAFGRKLFVVESGHDELVEKMRLARARGCEVFVVEMVPGPDDLLSSYYAYVNRDGEFLYHFTKSVIRRYPVNRGSACFHKTEWLPETAALGRALFEKLGLRGIGNVEFKRDMRDGKLKLIEINTRFTAAQELLTQAGAPLDVAVYCDLTGQPVPRFESYRQNLRLWYPQRDFLAFLELRRAGKIGLVEWLASIRPLAHVTPLTDLGDPLPTLGAMAAMAGQILRGRP